MAEQHRAKPWQWESIERKHYHAEFSCILELRDRVEALEAPIDLSHLSNDKREKILKLLANPGRFEVLEVAQPAQPNYPEKPDSSLVERVTRAMNDATEWQARAAIRAIAAWLREQGRYSAGVCSQLLEEEAMQ